MAKEKPEFEKEIRTQTEMLIDKLGVEAQVSVRKETSASQKNEEVNHYIVTIETKESGLLIGYHGETLNSLQLLLGVILFKKLGNWTRIVVDIGNYRQMRQDSITAMVDRMIEEAQRTVQPITLPVFTPLERRLVHMKLSTHPTLISQSEGLGKDRRVTIKPRGI